MKKQESNIIVIIEAAFTSIEMPKSISVYEFGSETVVGDYGKILATGTSVYLSGPTEDIREWIRSVGGKVWTSLSPMMGKWQLLEIGPKKA